MASLPDVLAVPNQCWEVEAILWVSLVQVLSLGRNISPFPYPRPSSKGIVTDGLYQYVRHPMYGGLLLICIGIGAITHSEARILLTLVLWWAMEKKVEFEEARLIERFPEYEKYKPTARKFFPFVY